MQKLENTLVINITVFILECSEFHFSFLKVKNSLEPINYLQPLFDALNFIHHLTLVFVKIAIAYDWVLDVIEVPLVQEVVILVLVVEETQIPVLLAYLAGFREVFLVV